jgi:hypothetical protein
MGVALKRVGASAPQLLPLMPQLQACRCGATNGKFGLQADACVRCGRVAGPQRYLAGDASERPPRCILLMTTGGCRDWSRGQSGEKRLRAPRWYAPRSPSRSGEAAGH